ncbi:SIR2 family protein [Bdellovibrio sp. HCB209]|uniref:SIR2 family protein n=1 Tax=Bdellovibrio sp. HCB209 TaxID=3394354 RepID=UPI0039B6D0A4
MNPLNRSTLIIGAGAHHEYDMPTSNELLKSIQGLRSVGTLTEDTFLYKDDANISFSENSSLRDKINIIDILQDLPIEAWIQEKLKGQKYNSHFAGRSFERINLFLELFLGHFCSSHTPSIDSYLSNLAQHPDPYIKELYRILGKVIIVYYISKAENESDLGLRNRGWIHFLISQFILKDPDTFFRNKPQIITFNYDRLLERMIFEHLIYQHHYKVEDALKLIDSLEIYHVYGSLGPYKTWHSEESIKSSDYYKNAISKLKVIDEDRSSDQKKEIIQNIQKRTQHAKYVYFLGYGFDADNNYLLKNGLYQNIKDKDQEYFTTSVNTNTADAIRIRDTLMNPDFLQKQTITCQQLVSEVAPLYINV